MRKLKYILILIVLMVMSSCVSPSGTSTSESTATPTLPNPQVHVTPAPDAKAMVDAFMSAWQVEDYEVMYALLTSDSQAVISQEDFKEKYLNTAAALTLKVDTGIE